MLFRRSRPVHPSAPAPDRWGPLAALGLELEAALALQEAAERVIAGCAGDWPVDGLWSGEGAPVVMEYLRISNRIGDLALAEIDSELKEDACYLVLFHQAAVDRALRLAFTADASEGSEQERRALRGLGAPAAQLRSLRAEIASRMGAPAAVSTG